MAEAMVIVGAGECGTRAALTLRELGHAGPIVLLGAEAHAPYERPPLSKAHITAEEVPAPVTVADAEKLAAARIDFRPETEAVAIDRAARSVVLPDGGRLGYDRLLLATGAKPRVLTLDGSGVEDTVYLRTFDDAVRIRSRLVPGARVAIVGGGFIGLELAASARQRGAEVTVIEAQARVLMRGVPEAIANALADRHRAAGVALVTGTGLVSIASEAGEVRLALDDGRVIEADLVIAGIGVMPCTALAEEAGIEVDNGIVVDETLRTSDPHIFAAGDCCAFPLAIYGGRRVRLESWRSALEQGALAARNMLGAGEAVSAVPWFWSDQYELSLHVAGLVDEGITDVRRDLGDGAFIVFHLAADGRLVAASGLGKGNLVARDVRLAEMLIARGARPEPGQLGSPDFKLKQLLAA